MVTITLLVLLMSSLLNASPVINPPVTARITDSADEGMEAFRVETGQAVYFYQKEAGGFSSILDREGRRLNETVPVYQFALFVEQIIHGIAPY